MKGDTDKIEIYMKFVHMFRDMDAEIPLTTVAVFLTVVQKGNITMKEMVKLLGISQSSCSRNVAYLAQYHRLNKPGLNLLVTMEDPQERRRKIVSPTQRGLRVVEQMRSMVS